MNMNGLLKRGGVVLQVWMLLAGCKDSGPERNAEAALASFELAPGFQIEMTAIEPLIADPIAMEIDEYGRMYVVEMHGYPLDKSGSGNVKLLTDTDGDGKMDKSVLFADGLVLPTGVMRWKKGILVTDAPNVLYLEDNDGDGKADIRDTLLTGFALSNPQHNVNNPVLGINNWIYIGHEPAVTSKMYADIFGDKGAEIYYPANPSGARLPENARGRSVRFRPDRTGLEVLSSFTQFGQTFDLWGHHLLVHNANHIYHEVIGFPYLERNPDLLIADATQSISDHGAAAEVYPITKNPEHQALTDVGVFTSSCGLTYYAGGLFPAPFDSVAFVAEPVSNLLHTDVLRDTGATFVASRLYQNKEFLASTDSWFRPVNMYIGPDGALYIIDYYRQIIEHPEWMADDVVKSGALYNGSDKGRIYRVTPKGTTSATWPSTLKLGDATSEELVHHLANKNIWWRRSAQRLLLDRQDKTIIPSLEKMITNPDAPLGRLHALWTLEGMNALQPVHIAGALKDKVAGIRENGIRLTELMLPDDPKLADDLLLLKNDPDPKVRFQLLCALGFVNTPASAKAREDILFKDVNDSWVQIAALSATSAKESGLLQAVLSRYKSGDPAYASLAERLSAMTAAGGQTATVQSLIRKSLTVNNKDGWQVPVLKGIAQGLRNGKISSSLLDDEKELLLNAVVRQSVHSKGSLAILKVIGLPAGQNAAKALEQALLVASDRSAKPENRTEAIGFLTFGRPETYTDSLKSFIQPNEPLPVQLAALRTLSTVSDPGLAPFLLDKWPSLTAELRDATINTFIYNRDRVVLLLDAIESNKIDQSGISWGSRVQLMWQSNDTLRNRARALFTKKDEQNKALLEEYKTALDLPGDPVKGKQIFQQNCALCHTIGGKGGIAYGPDLGTIKNRRPESVMGDILNPNQSIADGYDVWILLLKSGESVQGLIATETPSAITVRIYGGTETTIARKDIESLRSLGMSAMPVGLEKQIDHQQMADLLSYIRERK